MRKFTEKINNKKLRMMAVSLFIEESMKEYHEGSGKYFSYRDFRESVRLWDYKDVEKAVNQATRNKIFKIANTINEDVRYAGDLINKKLIDRTSKVFYIPFDYKDLKKEEIYLLDNMSKSKYVTVSSLFEKFIAKTKRTKRFLQHCFYRLHILGYVELHDDYYKYIKLKNKDEEVETRRCPKPFKKNKPCTPRKEVEPVKKEKRKLQLTVKNVSNQKTYVYNVQDLDTYLKLLRTFIKNVSGKKEFSEYILNVNAHYLEIDTDILKEEWVGKNKEGILTDNNMLIVNSEIPKIKKHLIAAVV